MELGVSISSSHPANGPALMIERARVAYESGMASLTIGDHHAMAIPYAQNTPMLGRMLAEWPDRPAGCLFLVPLWHPVLMAEQIGTLAAMHNGRFIVQTGIGRGRQQFGAMSAELGARGSRLEASINLIKALLAGETVDAPELDVFGAQVGLVPEDATAVEWWIAGGIDKAVRRAAAMGDAWYATAGAIPEEMMHSMRVYREAGGTRPIARVDALVLEDGDRARSIAGDLVANGYRGMSMNQLMVGSPDDAAEHIARFEAAGFTGISFRAMAVEQELALETITNLGGLNT